MNLSFVLFSLTLASEISTNPVVISWDIFLPKTAFWCGGLGAFLLATDILTNRCSLASKLGKLIAFLNIQGEIGSFNELKGLAEKTLSNRFRYLAAVKIVCGPQGGSYRPRRVKRFLRNSEKEIDEEVDLCRTFGLVTGDWCCKTEQRMLAEQTREQKHHETVHLSSV